MAKQPLKQFAYETIKEKILTCEYRPGAFLNEEFLCEELNISRTPIRDALVRLEAEQLITIMQKKGFIVKPVTSEQVNMVFEGRMLLEPYIIENYCGELSEHEFEEMHEISARYKQAIQNDDRSAYYAIDNQFHMCIISQCKNAYLLQTYEILQGHDRRIRVLTGTKIEQRLEETITEHDTILKHLENRDVEKAAAAMKLHLTNSKSSSIYIL